MAEVLAPHVTGRDGDLRRIQFRDGKADIYLRGDGMLANHIMGRDPWDLLVRGARAANWVILPVDCPTCWLSSSHTDRGTSGTPNRAKARDAGCARR